MENNTLKETKPKSSRMGTFLLVLVLILAVVGGIYYYAFSTPDPDSPPELKGETSFQGFIKTGSLEFITWEVLDATKHSVLKAGYEQAEVEPIEIKQGVNYLYAEEDMKFSDVLWRVDLSNKKSALLAYWNPDEEKFTIYPKNTYYTNESQLITIEDPNAFTIPAYKGFILVVSQDTVGYNLKDGSLKASTSTICDSEKAQPGWNLVPASMKELKTEVSPCLDSISLIWTQKSTSMNEFEKVYKQGESSDTALDDIELTNYIMWVKYASEPAADDTEDDTDDTEDVEDSEDSEDQDDLANDTEDDEEDNIEDTTINDEVDQAAEAAANAADQAEIAAQEAQAALQAALDAQSAMDELEDEVDEAGEATDVVAAAIAAVEEALQAVNDAINSLSAALQADELTEEDIEAAKEAVLVAIEKANQAAEAVAALQSEQEDVSDSVANAIAKVNASVEQAQSVVASVDELLEKLKTVEDEIDDIKEKIEDEEEPGDDDQDDEENISSECGNQIIEEGEMCDSPNDPRCIECQCQQGTTPKTLKIGVDEEGNDLTEVVCNPDIKPTGTLLPESAYTGTGPLPYIGNTTGQNITDFLKDFKIQNLPQGVSQSFIIEKYGDFLPLEIVALKKGEVATEYSILDSLEGKTKPGEVTLEDEGEIIVEEVESTCGDGVIDEGETCEKEGNRWQTKCDRITCTCIEGYEPFSGNNLCRKSTCSNNLNGYQPNLEECDGGTNCDPYSCVCLPGYYSNKDGNCVEVVAGCQNGQLDAGEECDPSFAPLFSNCDENTCECREGGFPSSNAGYCEKIDNTINSCGDGWLNWNDEECEPNLDPEGECESDCQCKKSKELGYIWFPDFNGACEYIQDIYPLKSCETGRYDLQYLDKYKKYIKSWYTEKYFDGDKKRFEKAFEGYPDSVCSYFPQNFEVARELSQVLKLINFAIQNQNN